MKADMSATARYHYLHIPSGNGAAILGCNGSGKHWLRQCRLVWNPWIIGALQHQYRDGGILQAAMDAGTGIIGIAVTIAGKPRGYMIVKFNNAPCGHRGAEQCGIDIGHGGGDAFQASQHVADIEPVARRMKACRRRGHIQRCANGHQPAQSLRLGRIIKNHVQRRCPAQ